MLTWHETQGHVVLTKNSGRPELEYRPQVVSLPANRTRGYLELRARTQGHEESPLGMLDSGLDGNSYTDYNLLTRQDPQKHINEFLLFPKLSI